MDKRTYCLFDHKANIYLNPLTFLNDGEAIRWFTTIVNSNEKTNVSLYPKDFTLCYLGTFNDVSGQFINDGKELIPGNAVKNTEEKLTLKEIYEFMQKEITKGSN